MEDIGKEYAQETSKFEGNRDEDFGSALLTFQQNLKLFRMERRTMGYCYFIDSDEKGVAVLRGSCWEKGSSWNHFPPALVKMFKQEFSNKESENEFWLEWNSLDWADIVAQ